MAFHNEVVGNLCHSTLKSVPVASLRNSISLRSIRLACVMQYYLRHHHARDIGQRMLH